MEIRATVIITGATEDDVNEATAISAIAENAGGANARIGLDMLLNAASENGGLEVAVLKVDAVEQILETFAGVAQLFPGVIDAEYKTDGGGND